MPKTNLQNEADKKDHQRVKTLEAYIPQEAKEKLSTILKGKYNDIVSKSATYIGRTNLIELDIPTEGPCISSQPYSIPLKYREFVDEDIQQLDDAGIIPRSMSDWASPILVVPKKPTPQDPNHLIRNSLTLDCVSTIEN